MTLLNVIKSTSIDHTPFDQIDPHTYQGTLVGFIQAAYPYLGNPDAPVTLEEYSVFPCPLCARHMQQTVPTLIGQFLQTRQAKYAFRDMPLVGLHPTASIGHAAACCAAEPGITYFRAIHDELLTHPNEWSRLPDPLDFVARAARALGIDTAAYRERAASGGKDTQVQESVLPHGRTVRLLKKR